MRKKKIGTAILHSDIYIGDLSGAVKTFGGLSEGEYTAYIWREKDKETSTYEEGDIGLIGLYKGGKIPFENQMRCIGYCNSYDGIVNIGNTVAPLDEDFCNMLREKVSKSNPQAKKVKENFLIQTDGFGALPVLAHTENKQITALEVVIC